jgi:hypothetical protein
MLRCMNSVAYSGLRPCLAPVLPLSCPCLALVLFALALVLFALVLLALVLLTLVLLALVLPLGPGVVPAAAASAHPVDP